ncbi:MAG: HEAT repeat domain-containing protein, partial [Ralstonia mannitolilytica]
MTTTTLARLHDADAATRRIALLQLADEEDADALPEVTALLAHDPAPEVRLEAARIIATWERPDTVAALARALEDADAAVREAAALGLGELKSADSAPALLPYVDHASAFVRAAALRGLRELRVPESDAPAL